jgi:hypothetical protein
LFVAIVEPGKAVMHADVAGSFVPLEIGLGDLFCDWHVDVGGDGGSGGDGDGNRRCDGEW